MSKKNNYLETNSIAERFFLWCSDTDIPTLHTVNHLDRKSKRYQVIYGRLVLIPTIMALVGTVHAMTDFTDNPLIYISVGVVVGWFVFTIDRAIIATYVKKEKGIGKQFWWRLILSLILGYIISLFFVFFFFQNRINEQINKDLFSKNISINTFYNIKKDSINKRLNKLILKSEKLISLKHAELSGYSLTLYIDSIKYETSGSAKSGFRTKNFTNMINSVNSEITYEKRKVKQALNHLTKDRENKLQKNNNQAKNKDPLIKLEMLIKVLKEHPLLLLLVIPIYLFLFVLDIIPIILKELFQKTKYDNLYRYEEFSKISLDLKNYHAKIQTAFDNSLENKLISQKSILDEMRNIYNRLSTVISEVNWYAIIPIGIIIAISVLYLHLNFQTNKEIGMIINILLSILGTMLSTGINHLTKKKKILKIK